MKRKKKKTDKQKTMAEVFEDYKRGIDEFGQMVASGLPEIAKDCDLILAQRWEINQRFYKSIPGNEYAENRRETMSRIACEECSGQGYINGDPCRVCLGLGFSGMQSLVLPEITTSISLKAEHLTSNPRVVISILEQERDHWKRCTEDAVKVNARLEAQVRVARSHIEELESRAVFDKTMAFTPTVAMSGEVGCNECGQMLAYELTPEQLKQVETPEGVEMVCRYCNSCLTLHFSIDEWTE